MNLNPHSAAIPSTLATRLNSPPPSDKAPSAEPIIPDNVQALFGKPALLPGEDLRNYEELLKQVVLYINPKTILEWLWVKDIVEYSYDILRHQRFKTAVVGLGRRRAVRAVVAKCIHEDKHAQHLNRLTDGFFQNQEVRKELQKNLSALGLTEDCIEAQAMVDASPDIAKIDALQGSATSRRNTAVREIERGRQQLLVAGTDHPEVIEVEPHDEEKKS